jgi:hypothetical protein
MANNYSQGATFVPASSLAPGGAQAAEAILGGLYESVFHSEDDDYAYGGLEVESTDKGDLYITSGDEYFCLNSFKYVVEKLAEKQLILESFGIEVAHYCSKLRPDEFGGSYYRAMPDGSVIAVHTSMDDIPDSKLWTLCELDIAFKE